MGRCRGPPPLWRTYKSPKALPSRGEDGFGCCEQSSAHPGGERVCQPPVCDPAGMARVSLGRRGRVGWRPVGREGFRGVRGLGRRVGRLQ